MLGSIFDHKYRIIRQIGSGGMGAVFEAERVADRGSVAIKVIRTPEAKNRVLIERFLREARLAASIDTPHIARILDLGMDPATTLPYMVMELLTGEDANQLVKRTGPLSADVALRIAAQAAAGLEKAHAARIIHRDVKSANLFLARGPSDAVTVKILDFGVAKARREDGDLGESNGLTRTGSVLGSPLFMSPEQGRGVKVIDERADTWSLGVVLYHLVSGRTPYQEIEALGELIIALCSGPPPHVHRFAPWVPPDVAGLLERALTLDPDKRFQTASEMRAAMLRLVSSDLIRVEMLEPVGHEDRARVSPSQVGVSSTAAVSPHAQTEAAVAQSDSGASTQSEMSRSAQPSRGAKRGAQVAFGAVSVVAIGTAVYFATRPPVIIQLPAAPGSVAAPASSEAAPPPPPASADPPRDIPTAEASSASVPASASAPVKVAAPLATVAKPRIKKPPPDTEGFGDRK